MRRFDPFGSFQARTRSSIVQRCKHLQVSSKHQCKCLNICTIADLVHSWKRLEWVKTLHATDCSLCDSFKHSLLYYIRLKYRWVQESGPILISYWVFTAPLWLNDCDCFGLGLPSSLLICDWISCPFSLMMWGKKLAESLHGTRLGWHGLIVGLFCNVIHNGNIRWLSCLRASAGIGNAIKNGFCQILVVTMYDFAAFLLMCRC